MLLSWQHSGFGVHSGEPVLPDDTGRQEHLARYITRAPIRLDAITPIDAEQVRVRTPIHPNTGQRNLELDVLEMIRRLCAQIPAPRQHLTRRGTGAGGGVCLRIRRNPIGGSMPGEQSCGGVSRCATTRARANHRTENSMRGTPVSKVIARLVPKTPYTIHYPWTESLPIGTARSVVTRMPRINAPLIRLATAKRIWAGMDFRISVLTLKTE